MESLQEDGNMSVRSQRSRKKSLKLLDAEASYSYECLLKEQKKHWKTNVGQKPSAVSEGNNEQQHEDGKKFSHRKSIEKPSVKDCASKKGGRKSSRLSSVHSTEAGSVPDNQPPRLDDGSELRLSTKDFKDTPSAKPVRKRTSHVKENTDQNVASNHDVHTETDTKLENNSPNGRKRKRKAKSSLILTEDIKIPEAIKSADTGQIKNEIDSVSEDVPRKRLRRSLETKKTLSKEESIKSVQTEVSNADSESTLTEQANAGTTSLGDLSCDPQSAPSTIQDESSSKDLNTCEKSTEGGLADSNEEMSSSENTPKVDFNEDGGPKPKKKRRHVRRSRDNIDTGVPTSSDVSPGKSDNPTPVKRHKKKKLSWDGTEKQAEVKERKRRHSHAGPELLLDLSESEGGKESDENEEENERLEKLFKCIKNGVKANTSKYGSPEAKTENPPSPLTETKPDPEESNSPDKESEFIDEPEKVAPNNQEEMSPEVPKKPCHLRRSRKVKRRSRSKDEAKLEKIFKSISGSGVRANTSKYSSPERGLCTSEEEMRSTFDEETGDEANVPQKDGENNVQIQETKDTGSSSHQDIEPQVIDSEVLDNSYHVPVKTEPCTEISPSGLNVEKAVKAQTNVSNEQDIVKEAQTVSQGENKVTIILKSNVQGESREQVVHIVKPKPKKYSKCDQAMDNPVSEETSDHESSSETPHKTRTKRSIKKALSDKVRMAHLTSNETETPGKTRTQSVSSMEMMMDTHKGVVGDNTEEATVIVKEESVRGEWVSVKQEDVEARSSRSKKKSARLRESEESREYEKQLRQSMREVVQLKHKKSQDEVQRDKKPSVMATQTEVKVKKEAVEPQKERIKKHPQAHSDGVIPTNRQSSYYGYCFKNWFSIARNARTKDPRKICKFVIEKDLFESWYSLSTNTKRAYTYALKAYSQYHPLKGKVKVKEETLTKRENIADPDGLDDAHQVYMKKMRRSFKQAFRGLENKRVADLMNRIWSETSPKLKRLWLPDRWEARKQRRLLKQQQLNIKIDTKPDKKHIDTKPETCPECDTYMLDGQRYFYLCNKHRTEKEAQDGISCIRPRESRDSTTSEEQDYREMKTEDQEDEFNIAQDNVADQGPMDSTEDDDDPDGSMLDEDMDEIPSTGFKLECGHCDFVAGSLQAMDDHMASHSTLPTPTAESALENEVTPTGTNSMLENEVTQAPTNDAQGNEVNLSTTANTSSGKEGIHSGYDGEPEKENQDLTLPGNEIKAEKGVNSDSGIVFDGDVEKTHDSSTSRLPNENLEYNSEKDISESSAVPKRPKQRQTARKSTTQAGKKCLVSRTNEEPSSPEPKRNYLVLGNSLIELPPLDASAQLEYIKKVVSEYSKSPSRVHQELGLNVTSKPSHMDYYQPCSHMGDPKIKIFKRIKVSGTQDPASDQSVILPIVSKPMPVLHRAPITPDSQLMKAKPESQPPQSPPDCNSGNKVLVSSPTSRPNTKGVGSIPVEVKMVQRTLSSPNEGNGQVKVTFVYPTKGTPEKNQASQEQPTSSNASSVQEDSPDTSKLDSSGQSTDISEPGLSSQSVLNTSGSETDSSVDFSALRAMLEKPVGDFTGKMDSTLDSSQNTGVGLVSPLSAMETNDGDSNENAVNTDPGGSSKAVAPVQTEDHLYSSPPLLVDRSATGSTSPENRSENSSPLLASAAEADKPESPTVAVAEPDKSTLAAEFESEQSPSAEIAGEREFSESQEPPSESAILAPKESNSAKPQTSPVASSSVRMVSIIRRDMPTPTTHLEADSIVNQALESLESQHDFTSTAQTDSYLTGESEHNTSFTDSRGSLGPVMKIEPQDEPKQPSDTCGSDLSVQQRVTRTNWKDNFGLDKVKEVLDRFKRRGRLTCTLPATVSWPNNCICGKTYEKTDCYIQHIRRVHNWESDVFLCKYCFFATTEETAVKPHHTSCHPNKEMPSYVFSMVCTHLPSGQQLEQRVQRNLFSQDDNSEVNPYTLSRGREFYCSYCRFSTDDIGALNVHSLMKHPDKAAAKTSTEAGNLSQHDPPQDKVMSQDYYAEQPSLQIKHEPESTWEGFEPPSLELAALSPRDKFSVSPKGQVRQKIVSPAASDDGMPKLTRYNEEETQMKAKSRKRSARADLYDDPKLLMKPVVVVSDIVNAILSGF